MTEQWLTTLRARVPPATRLLAGGDARLDELLPGLPAAWHAALTGTTVPGEAVEQIWAPLHERARGWVTRLATITEGF